ncbi:MAG: hypothetical protein QNJ88_05160 [Acidimicrobiia bacterium]|nr:hypothetical protein [Acidimicrobiia bacterium]
MDGTYWLEILRPIYEGRKFILALDRLAGAGRTLKILRDLGADTPFIVAAARGQGELPAPDEAEVAMVDVEGGTTMEWLRNVESTMANLPMEVVERIDAWDPSGEAVALGPFMFGEATVAGRPLYGARPDRFVALEDKMTADALWDRAFVTRSPSRLVRLDAPELAEAAAQLDWGMGTFWAGDATQGWHGGGEVARWVPDPSYAAAAQRYLTQLAESVRVMPFLEGIPCSIYGIVFPDRVITVRPAEMLTLRQPARGVIKYVGTATFYDPPADLRIAMEQTAIDVGETLRSELDYAGAFTIDGVATRHGFLPTELNPRLGAGLFRATSRIDGLWLIGLQRALTEGEPLDYRPADLERFINTTADEYRNGVAFVMVDEAPTDPVAIHVDFVGNGVVIVDDADGADATIEWGFGNTAGAVSVRFNPDHTPIGESVAPRAAAGLRFAADHWHLNIPNYEPAVDVHR